MTGDTVSSTLKDDAKPEPREAARRSTLRFERIVVIGGGCYGSWYAQQLLRATGAGASHTDATRADGTRAHADASRVDVARGASPRARALSVDEIVVVDRNPACKVIQARDAGDFGDAPVTVVTSTWSDYLTDWLQRGERALTGHALVPSPLMPHLLLEWLVSRASVRWPARAVTVEPLAHAPRIPWERAAPDGRHYVSFAEWMCPINCIEPALCPATGGPRSWSMPYALQSYVDAHRTGDELQGPVVFHCAHRTHGVGMIDAAPIAAADSQIANWGADGPLRVLVGTVSHCHGALGVLVAR